MSGIYHTYVWYTPRFFYFQFDCFITEKKNVETATTTQNEHAQMTTKAGSTHDLLSNLYHRYIPGIHMSNFFSSTLAGLLDLPSAPGCFGSALSADSFCFCN
jgi:hypothetical protein